MWPDCLHFITVLMYCCALAVYNALNKKVLLFDGFCTKVKRLPDSLKSWVIAILTAASTKYQNGTLKQATTLSSHITPVSPFISISETNTARHSTRDICGVYTRGAEVGMSLLVERVRWFPSRHAPRCVMAVKQSRSVLPVSPRWRQNRVCSGVSVSCRVQSRDGAPQLSGNTRIDVVVRNKRRATRSMRSVFWFPNSATYIFIYEHPMNMLLLSDISSQTCSFQ